MAHGVGATRVNICRVSKSFLPRQDGWAAHAFHLSEHQAALGHTVLVLQPFSPSEERGGLTIRHVPLGPFADHLEGKAAGVVLCGRALPSVISLHRRQALDILHLHGDVLEALVLAPWTRMARVPAVLTLHSGLNRRARYRFLAQRVFRLLDGFIAVSPAVRDDLLSLGVPTDRIAVISSGVDTRRFRPPTPGERLAARAALRLRDEEMVILSVGRLHAVKGYTALIRGVDGLAVRPAPRVFVLGEGPQGRALRQEARDLPNMQFVGGVGREDVVRYLHAADVFILPSVDLPGVREGTPTALLEAMACGLPVVCTDSGGMGQVIRDGEGGLVVPQHDPVSLRAALQMLLTRPPLRRRFGRYNAALSHEHEWRRTAGRVVAFYEYVRERSAWHRHPHGRFEGARPGP